MTAHEPNNPSAPVGGGASSQLLGAVREFMRTESAGGILLLVAALLAVVLANTPLARFYSGSLNTPVAVQVGALLTIWQQLSSSLFSTLVIAQAPVSGASIARTNDGFV